MLVEFLLVVKVIFLGTPEFACPSLEALIAAEDIDVVALITQPDKAVGRKQVITSPPTKVLAKQHGIDIYQPAKLNKDSELIGKLQTLKPDFLVTVAYGQILSQKVLDIAPVINLHASLLPEYRGPAPINWMIINGDSKAGLTTMLTDKGVDTGDILLKVETDINEGDDAQTLSEKLSRLGVDLLLQTLRDYSSINPEKQGSVEASRQYAPFMDKKLGELDFNNHSAREMHNLVRGTYPWPGAYFNYDDQKVIVLETQRHCEESIARRSNPENLGQIVAIDKSKGSFTVQTRDGQLEITKLKAQGKSEMQASDWLNGKRLSIGCTLSSVVV